MTETETEWEWWGGPYDGSPAEVEQSKTAKGLSVSFNLTKEEANDGDLRLTSKFQAPVAKRNGKMLIQWHLRSRINEGKKS